MVSVISVKCSHGVSALKSKQGYSLIQKQKLSSTAILCNIVPEDI